MNCAIIGAGASGLLAAIVALKSGLKVSIYEKNSKVGRKILATGNGRCNITNANLNLSKYHSSNMAFVNSVLQKFTYEQCINFFFELGLKIEKKENDRCYPLSLQASSVVDILVHEVKARGGEIKLDTFVEKITKNGDLFEVVSNNKKEYFDNVLLSCGSYAMKKLGSSSSGYDLAKYFGHEITKTYPSLVQLICKEDNLIASGVKFDSKIKVLVCGSQKATAFGDCLLTKYGLSGSAILDISRIVSLNLDKKIEIVVDCLYQYSKQELSNLLFTMQKNNPKKPILLVLQGLIYKKIALLVLNRCKISPQKIQLNKKELNHISYALKNLIFTPIDTKGEEFCEVIAGGVSLDDIDKSTLSSTLCEGLYFSGEILDVDGDCGGYNLHWAWASGYVSAKGIAAKL